MTSENFILFEKLREMIRDLDYLSNPNLSQADFRVIDSIKLTYKILKNIDDRLIEASK